MICLTNYWALHHSLDLRLWYHQLKIKEDVAKLPFEPDVGTIRFGLTNTPAFFMDLM